jgi:hypothetical protein
MEEEAEWMVTRRLALDTTVVLSADQVSSEVGDEAVILGLSRGRYYGLNEVGLFIWRLLQTPHRLSEVCDQVVAAYQVDRQQAEADVLELVGRLVDEGLVQPAAA